MKNSIPWLFLFLLVAFESSGQFNLFPPSITAQRTLSVNQNGSIAIDFNDITVVDLLQLPAYPIGYTMSITSPGDHYTALSNVVTPERNYNGNITVPITVNDGTFTSEPWPLVIRVVKVDNIVPVIEGQVARLSTPHATPIVLKLTDLKVTDPDNIYPDEFTMDVKSGQNYRRNQLTVTPDANFSGTLTVNVTVKDGKDESAEFPMTIEVLPPANQKPVITATTPLTTTVGTTVTVAFGDLTVTDDNPYPGIFTMTLYDGPGYTHSGRIITPTGTTATTLSVPVSVNDGSLESDLSNITVQVDPRPNIKPKITGPAVALSTFINTPLTLTLDELTVEDPDNVYPTDFTLNVSAGTNCTVSGSTITPTPGFTGNMTVSVIVNDKTIDSDPVTLTIPVNPRPNIKPKINGTTIAFTTFVNTAITIPLTTLVVEDTDNNFPSDFTMQLYAGQNYTFSNNTVTPAPSFKGELKVPVTVSDGKATSDPFVITVEVSEKPTVAPKITGQDALKTFISTPITLKVTNLRIDDADTSYPDGFTIKILDGAGYTHTANTITPNLLFIGKLKVPITVSDGINESPRFDLEITVDILPNVAPRITASKDLSTFVGQPVKIELTDLSVTDPDNTYPGSFKLTLYKGDNYNFSNTTVTPSAGFDGLIKVTVSVNDGTAESNSWEVNINVTRSPNVAPVIAGQKTNPYSVDEDKPLTLSLDMLTVTDPDNTFPTDFKLKILPPLAAANYSVNGDVITPSLNFNGDLNVRVSVNDGSADSAPYNLKVKVNPVNDPPIVTSQLPLSTQVATAIELKLSQLTISDPDNTTFTFKVNDVSDRSGYTVSGNTITPAAGFKGELKVSVSISDGTATIQHNMIVNVVDKPNTPPVITAQKPKPLIAVMNTPLTITNINLEVTDPDKQQFQIATISPGANYTATGATITPGNNYTGPLTVPITVTDGTATSAPFNLEVTVVAPSARPQIVGQSPIAANEDEPFTIRLQDLIVTDTDDQYPNGFKLQIVNSPAYTYIGNSVTAAKDFNGFLQVLVTVTDDGGQVSNQYGVAVLVSPVNDAPVISQFETNSLSYQPGKDPIVVTSQFEVTDVDNEYLSFAVVSIEKEKYQKGHDQLIFTSTDNIRGIFDNDSGNLSLLGYAPIADYQAAIRSIQYNFILADVEAGEPEVLPTDKKITFSVHDGQKDSEPKSRNIIMETNVSIRIPTAFSPNDDRFNATWQVIALSNKQQLENAIVKVYDKRGLLLFESKGVESQWDGKYNGQPLPSDTYFYTVDLMLTYAKKTYKGAVTLLR